MHSLEPELRRLLGTDRVAEPVVRLPLALETRSLFSVRRELRSALYAGIGAVTAGVGLVIQQNLDRIGALSITLALAAAALFCYLPAIRVWHAGEVRRLPADLLLLLGALLFSADLGYAEHSYHLLGTSWTQHFLLLAAFHGATAYVLGSRLVLSVALTAFAAWMGADTTFSFFFPLSRANLQGTGWRSLCCALVFVGCSVLQARHHARRADFIGVYEGFAVHLSGIGALLLMLPGYFDRPMPAGSLWLGTAALVAVVVGVGGIGWTRRQGSFVLAALAYAIAGAWRLEFHLLDDPIALTAASVVTLVGAIFVLWRTHARFKDEP